MAGIGVIYNPRSRRNLRDPAGESRLRERLGDHGLVRAARSVEELRGVAREFQRLEVDVLAISGGDGTNTVTLTEFLDVYGAAPLPPVALLRGGTMNTVANAIGTPNGTPDALLGALVRERRVRGAAALAVATLNLLRVEDVGAGKIHYGFLFGTGVMHGFLAEYYAGGDPSPLVAAKTLARGIGSAFVRGTTIRRMAEPFRGSVVLGNGAVWEERDYLAVAAGTVSHIGLSFKPFYRAGEQAGTFHALGIYASASQFVVELPRVHRGVPMRPGRAYDALTRAMRLEGSHGPLKYMVDGDLHAAPPSRGVGLEASSTKSRVDVRIGPRVSLVALPKG